MALTCTGVAAFRTDQSQEKLQTTDESLQFELRYESYELASRYPNHVIFGLTNSDRIVAHKGCSASDGYDFNWNAVKYLSSTLDAFEIQMPDIHREDGKLSIANTRVRGPKRVGWSMIFYTDGELSVILQILDQDRDGIVFMIGLATTKTALPRACGRDNRSSLE